jgi:hypothetical protein
MWNSQISNFAEGMYQAQYACKEFTKRWKKMEGRGMMECARI